MTPCANCRLEVVTRPHAHHLGRRVSQFCDPCVAALTKVGMSLTLVERRQHGVPVATERRHNFRPAWLTRLTAREDGSWRAA